MGDCAPHFDRDYQSHRSHSLLERLQGEVLVGKNEIRPTLIAQTHTGGDVTRIGAKPGVALGLLEDVMEDGVVSVIIHLREDLVERRGGDKESWLVLCRTKEW